MTQSIAAEVLREARDQASLSQSQLADAAGTYQSVVGRIEAGKASPSLETLSRMVQAAGFELRLSLEPVEVKDPVIEAYKPGVDQALLVEGLRRSANDRVQANTNLNRDFVEVDRAMGRRPTVPLVLDRLLGVLQSHNVEFVIVGGIAARVHGSARVTQNVDIVLGRSDANIGRLVKALAPLNPYPYGAAPNLPFDWSARTVKAGLNFELTTTLGATNIVGEVVGGGRYEDLVGHAVTVKLFGHNTQVLSLPWLIRLKRAAGRVRDYQVIAELELLQDLERQT